MPPQSLPASKLEWLPSLCQLLSSECYCSTIANRQCHVPSTVITDLLGMMRVDSYHCDNGHTAVLCRPRKPHAPRIDCVDCLPYKTPFLALDYWSGFLQWHFCVTLLTSAGNSKQLAASETIGENVNDGFLCGALAV
ncbi:hypothetical protein BaRGS_00003500 [Batillaria attramentaria]|uniref:Uncharacterized protein n=1 Tax=Batillaria attramentaria TaxID=370345 RepID=A0ABD0M207_9CAEN